MTFIINNQIQDSSLEQEIFSTKEFGFTAILTLKDGSVQILNNITEVHYLFKDAIFTEDKACAFESDIHADGVTRQLNRLSSIVIFDAVEMSMNYIYN